MDITNLLSSFANTKIYKFRLLAVSVCLLAAAVQGSQVADNQFQNFVHKFGKNYANEKEAQLRR